MTIKITSQAGVARALACLAGDMDSGIIDGCSLYYEAGRVARLSIRYKLGKERMSALSDLPGVKVYVDEEGDTDVAKEPTE